MSKMKTKFPSGEVGGDYETKENESYINQSKVG
jgi:hypothetical protein